MKKLLAILVFVLMGTISFAQYWSPNGTHIFNTNTGNVGIGSSAPLNMLEVTKSAGEATIAIRNTGGASGASFYMFDQLTGGKWKFKSAAAGAFKIRDQAMSQDVVTIEQNALANALYIKTGGNVGIGTTNPVAKLSVNGTGTFNGKVKCTEVEVLLAAWPDYVFESGYNLRPLSEVENFINLNKHLPDVPKAETVVANGANLGQMNATLLQKVEELTLYMIQLKKDNDALKARVANLEK
jgi:hypothetical protein